MPRAIWKLGTVVWAAGVALATGLAAVPASAANDDLASRSSIVFRGTVQDVGNTTLAALPPSDEAMVVRVDAVMKKPGAVVVQAGDRVTVLSETAASFNEGERAVFFTNGELFGETLAVRLVGTETVRMAAAARGAPDESGIENGADMDEPVSAAQMARVLETADAVIVGEVKEVRVPTVAALREAPRRITEHDPQWREAVIEVTTAIKGAEAGQQMVVRFPASRDVAWYRAPKPEVGQVSTFVLRRDETTGAPTATLAGQEVPAYQALEEGSVLPSDAAGRVRSLLKE